MTEQIIWGGWLYFRVPGLGPKYSVLVRVVLKYQFSGLVLVLVTLLVKSPVLVTRQNMMVLDEYFTITLRVPMCFLWVSCLNKL